MTARAAPPSSLRGRLLRALAVTQLVVFVVMSGLYLRAEWRGEMQQRAQELGRIAAVVAAAFEDEDHDASDLTLPDWVREAIAVDRADIAILDAAGTTLFTTEPELGGRLGPAVTTAERSGVALAGEIDPRPVAWRRLARRNGEVAWVIAVGAENGDALRHWLAEEVLSELTPTLLVFLAASLSVSWLSVRRDLAPIARLSAAAAALRPGEDGGRLAEDGAPLEITPLVRAMNMALARADDAVARQRRLVADAAHELRTPLAVLQAKLDGGALDPAALRGDLAGLSRLVGQLLTKARAEAGTGDALVDLAATARSCLADLAPAALAAGRDLELITPETASETALERGVMIRADPDGMAAAIRNLIENAVAFTPAGEMVEVEVTAGGAVWVRDRGPGVRPEDMPLLFQPFWRAPGQSRPGAGLGLAIVQDAASRAGYAVIVRNRCDGGAEFGLTPTAKAVTPAANLS